MRRMVPKQGMRKRPAAGSNETLCDLQPGFLLDDATALDRRAKRAATEAAYMCIQDALEMSCMQTSHSFLETGS